MTLKHAIAPHERLTHRYTHMTRDVLIALVPLCLFSLVYFGLRPILLILCGMATAMLCESVCCLVMRRPISIHDGSAAVTGALCGAVVSPLSPYWLPVLAAAFAVIVVKMPFGGCGRNLFNPAAAGIAVITQCFSSYLFTYADPGLNIPLPVIGIDNVEIVTAPAAQMQSGGSGPAYTWVELLLGQFPGPIAATAVLVLLACALYLFIRRTASPLITLPYLAACAAMAALFPRVSPYGQTSSVLMELCIGYLLFAGIFLLSDPVTAPRFWLGRIVYGALAGVLVMVFRHSGAYQEGACFAILLVNALSSVIDRFCWRLAEAVRLRLTTRKEGAAK